MAPGMNRRPIRRRMALPVGLAVAAIACSYGNQIEGALAAADGVTGLRCAVSTRPAEFQNASWDRCGVADAPGYVSDQSMVPLGERFRCQVSANVDRVYLVEVQCPGYERLVVDVLVESCVGLFASCDPVQTGTLVVQR